MGQWKEDSGLSTLGHYRMFSSVDSMRGGVFIADFRTDVRRASNRLVSQRPLEPALVGVSDFVEREVDRAEAEAALAMRCRMRARTARWRRASRPRSMLSRPPTRP